MSAPTTASSQWFGGSNVYEARLEEFGDAVFIEDDEDVRIRITDIVDGGRQYAFDTRHS
jgi:hypothetical protein